MDDNGNLVTLELSTYYVPALSNNLLSVCKLRKKQIMSDMQTHEGKASLTKAGVTVWSVIGSSVDLYMFEHIAINKTQASAYVGVGLQTVDLWHARMGHLGYQNLARLVHRGTGLGQSIPKHQLRDFPVCDECTRANQQRASFKHTHTEHADTVNGLIFTDIKGPIETDSFGGKRYVLLFVDDWSGYMTVYLIRHKSEALEMFKEYMAHAKNKHGRGVVTVNSDNGGEFKSPAWIDFCREQGIARRTTTPYTPEQNGGGDAAMLSM
ncbi:hypothetical protein JG688_00013687 [Phytophthora aleatoria]|uniref:Integrase catalytic domain-containing protein n=1 Tax=Phytophthora aleatoria TaxID=2496075 RepID=A0A8J5MDU4_9STRA|nr:hypothetical protein JG688_00013687 [Phytophthora aleatoria]